MPWYAATALSWRKSASPPQGTDTYPDATFTLRLSYGAVAAIPKTARAPRQKARSLPYFTTIGGAYEHAAQHGNKDPYELPESWMNAKSKVNLNTPLNVVETADIIGGNSGSPVINKSGEIVGIIFDGNIQSLPWNFVYDDTIGPLHPCRFPRHPRSPPQHLRRRALADELTGKTTPPAKNGAPSQ